MSFVRRKITALLVALALLVGIAPTLATAAPERTSAAMTMMDGMMNCDQQMPAKDRHMPCDDNSTCLGMLGCAMAAMPMPATSGPAGFTAFKPSWSPQREPDAVTARPALPPPIA